MVGDDVAKNATNCALIAFSVLGDAENAKKSHAACEIQFPGRSTPYVLARNKQTQWLWTTARKS
jgi:hypothetical protein